MKKEVKPTRVPKFPSPRKKVLVGVPVEDHHLIHLVHPSRCHVGDELVEGYLHDNGEICVSNLMSLFPPENQEEYDGHIKSMRVILWHELGHLADRRERRGHDNPNISESEKYAEEYSEKHTL